MNDCAKFMGGILLVCVGTLVVVGGIVSVFVLVFKVDPENYRTLCTVVRTCDGSCMLVAPTLGEITFPYKSLGMEFEYRGKLMSCRYLNHTFDCYTYSGGAERQNYEDPDDQVFVTTSLAKSIIDNNIWYIVMLAASIMFGIAFCIDLVLTDRRRRSQSPVTRV